MFSEHYPNNVQLFCLIEKLRRDSNREVILAAGGNPGPRPLPVQLGSPRHLVTSIAKIKINDDNNTTYYSHTKNNKTKNKQIHQHSNKRVALDEILRAANTNTKLNTKLTISKKYRSSVFHNTCKHKHSYSIVCQLL